MNIAEAKDLDLQMFPSGEISTAWIHLVNNGLGEAIRVPVLIAKGSEDGPVFGLTAAIHGNELNGMAVIQRLFQLLDPQDLKGCIVGVLAANVPGVIRGQREFNNGVDLNRAAPGKHSGTESDVYLARFLDRIVSRFDYLIDLHTASFGRINSYYVRADMSDPVTERMARLQNSEIILNNPPSDRSIRGSAEALGIKAVTVELRDPNIFQFDVIQEAIVGINNILFDFQMLQGSIVCPIEETILCNRAEWLYTDEGGILVVPIQLLDFVKVGELVGEVQNIFGTVQKTYHAKKDGIVIGKSVNPINQTGSRIVHLGYEIQQLPCLVSMD